MAVNNLVKRLQNVMRQDAGISGDAQRIEQMTWLFFLKVYDAQEDEWEFKSNGAFHSVIPEPCRWRNWATDTKDGKALTGDELLDFVNNNLFPTLQKLPLMPSDPRAHWIVKEVFADLNQYMKNGVLLRQVVNIVDEIDFTDVDDRHTFGDIYEGILKDLQSAGNAGEFYTPRALTDFIIETLNPRLGESVADFTSGTGGFLTSALNYLAAQRKTPQDEELWQNSVHGQEWKPLPYLLSITNLLVHGVDEPDIIHCDSLGTPVSSFQNKDRVSVIAMNPPYGGSTEASVKMNFPTDMRSSETADLFMVLIMKRLLTNGRAGVIIPDGFLFGTDGAKLAIKTALLREFNLHTIIRLPGSIFAPYTSINTNIVFFNNETAEGAEEGFKTKDVWFYRLDMPEGYKHFSKTKPMRLEHCQPIRDWWNDRKEIIVTDEEGNVLDEKSRHFTAQQLIDLSCNFDQCKFPKSEEEVLPPAELLADYHKRREALDAQIDKMLSNIGRIMEGGHVDNHGGCAKVFEELALLQQSFPARLRQSILQEAISGRLVPQDPNDEPASVLLQRIREEKARLVKEGTIKAKEVLEYTIDDIPYELPDNWSWVKLGEISYPIKRGKSPVYVENSQYIAFAQKCNTKKGYIDLDLAKYIESKKAETQADIYLKLGDIVINSTGTGTLGRVGLFNVEYPENIIGVVPDSHVATVRLLSIYPEYAYYFLRTCQAYLESLGEGGTNQKELKPSSIAELLFPLPPLAEQQRIVEKIEELFAEIDKLK